MRPPLQFFVPGMPATGGSKRGFIHRHTGRVVVIEDCRRAKPWRVSVQGAARHAMKSDPRLWTGPLKVVFQFCLPRPKGHMGARGLKPSAPPYPITRPDVLKLARAAEDALTGIVWGDDAQIVTERLLKRFAPQNTACGLWITVSEEAE